MAGLWVSCNNTTSACIFLSWLNIFNFFSLEPAPFTFHVTNLNAPIDVCVWLMLLAACDAQMNKIWAGVYALVCEYVLHVCHVRICFQRHRWSLVPATCVESHWAENETQFSPCIDVWRLLLPVGEHNTMPCTRSYSQTKEPRCMWQCVC